MVCTGQAIPHFILPLVQVAYLALDYAMPHTFQVAWSQLAESVVLHRQVS